MDVLPNDFLSDKGIKQIELMQKDQINEIKLLFVWNMPKIAKYIPFVLFNNRILPIYLKNFKSKNRFIKEDSFLVLGETINSMINKNDEQPEKLFDSNSLIFKLIEQYYQLPT